MDEEEDKKQEALVPEHTPTGEPKEDLSWSEKEAVITELPSWYREPECKTQ